MQRACGCVTAAFASRAGETVLRRLREEGSAKMRLPRRYGADLEAIMINTAGGLAGGDRFQTEITVADGARVTVTTQAGERVYRSVDDAAAVEASLTVGAKARLDWLPRETILFDRARLRRAYAIELDPTATFLAIEAFILGRTAMGERVRGGSLHDRWRVRRGGRLVFADDLRFDGPIGSLTENPAALGGRAAFATILYVGTESERHLDETRAAIGDAGGASALDGKLVARVTADGSLRLVQILSSVATILRGGRSLPRVWQM
jgi:urease accessory protein